jgi:hypothetical protein
MCRRTDFAVREYIAPPMNHRTIAIGDIHGCSAALDALLEAIRPRPADRIVTLGDYIDDLGHVKVIDMYCYGGGWLTALDVQTEEVWQADRDGNLRRR